MKKQHTGKKHQKKIATKEGRQVPVCCNIGSTGRPSLVYEYVKPENDDDVTRAFKILIAAGMRKLEKLKEQNQNYGTENTNSNLCAGLDGEAGGGTDNQKPN